MEEPTRRGPGRPPRLPQQEALESPAQQSATSDTAQQPSPRSIEVRQERRRRDAGNVDVMARQKLAIPPEIQEELNRKGLTARWALDKGGRVQQLKAEDWDIVPGVDRVAASRSEEGEHVLMCKRKDWYDDDRQHLVDLNRDRQKRATKQRSEAGEVDSFADHEGNAQAEKVYSPRHTQNRISSAETRLSRGA